MGRKEINEPSLDKNEIFISRPNYSAATKNGEIIGNYISSNSERAKIFFNNPEENSIKYTIVDADKNLLDYIIRNYTITYDGKNTEAVSNSNGKMESLHKIVVDYYMKEGIYLRICHNDGNKFNNTKKNLSIKKKCS
ncbi:MAG: hypothetical protein ACRDA5_04655 [Clostridium sp.]